MKRLLIFGYSMLLLPVLCLSQFVAPYDDFEGNGNITNWEGDNCEININFNNPFQDAANTSSTVLRYSDWGGQYANVRFQMNEVIDFAEVQTFSIKIYVPENGITGNQNNQVSLKLQNGDLATPWVTQSEIIKPLALNEWQTVTFNFSTDDYINLDPTSPPPTQRTDFNRVLIQVNGENNNDQVVAYIDDVMLFDDQGDGYVYDELVWSDEFDSNGAVNPAKWHHQTLFPQGDSWFNGEIQHYTNRIDNAYVDNGTLKILAKRENFTDQGVTKAFTSARLNSKFSFTYGRVEIRAKLPTGIGTWPAMWTLGKNINENGAYWDNLGFGTLTWPACGEIDIMEHWGDNQDYVSSAIHTPSSFGGTVNTAGRLVSGVSESFHDYTMIWTPEEIEFQIDGITHYSYTPTVQNDETWPFDLEQYLVLNVAILPNIGASFTESALEIDYIRIYQESTSQTSVAKAANTLLSYPVPFKEAINIDIGASVNASAKVSIYDTKGSVVKNTTVQLIDGRAVMGNLSQLPAGAYHIHCIVNGKTYLTKSIKKQ